MARVTERVMLYRSLMTSTVWAPTLDELCVCLCAFCMWMCGFLFMHVFDCLCPCAFIHSTYMCVCVWLYTFTRLVNMILGDDHLYIAWWWMGFLWLTGLHSYRLHCKSVCVVQAGQEGGRAPFLSVRHWYCGLKRSVGHFCFIRS